MSLKMYIENIIECPVIRAIYFLGHGVIATKSFEKGQLLLEYAGMVLILKLSNITSFL